MTNVYCFGHISTGMLYRLKDNFPSSNGYGEIIGGEENFSGEALSTAIVLRRLNVDVCLEGNWIGDTPAGERTRAFIKNEGIDDQALFTKPGYAGVEEVVFSDKSSRTVFGRYENLLFTHRQWEMPSEPLVRNASIACADPSFGEASSIVADIATKNKIPFVAIDTAYDSFHHQTASVSIISEEFLQRTYERETYDLLFEKYLSQSPGLTVFTFGEKNLWYGRTQRNFMQPFDVDSVIDTTGAGDSFRAGVIYGLLHGYTDKQMLRFACGVAASVIQTSPGVKNFSGKKDVDKILSQRIYETNNLAETI